MPFDSKPSFSDVYEISEQEYQHRRQTLTELCLPNRDLPYFSIDMFKNAGCLYEHGGDHGLAPVSSISVDKIIIGSSLNHWGDVGSFKEPDSLNSLWRTVELMKSKSSYPSHYALNIQDWGGIYRVVDGQRRVMAAKALGIQALPARVLRVYPTVLTLPSEASYQDMLRRQAKDQWQGNLSFKLDGSGSYNSGEAQVQNSEGIWIFSQNPDKIKKIYQDVGASGQAELFI